MNDELVYSVKKSVAYFKVYSIIRMEGAEENINENNPFSTEIKT